MKIAVFTKEDEEYLTFGTELRHLKPRLYMLGYDFNQLMKYTKEERYWEDIKDEDVIGFELYDRGYWTKFIARGE